MVAANEFSADLHLHSNASDGELSPSELIRFVSSFGVSAVAVTDHDTVLGVQEAVKAGESLQVDVLPGVELSAGGSEEIHLLGYGVRTDNPSACTFFDRLIDERRNRMETMLERLKELQMPIIREDAMSKGVGIDFMGRMNLARAMTRRGYVKTTQEAFTLFLDPGRPAYVPRRRISVPEGIEKLRSFGAVVCLAHPGRLKMNRSTMLMRLPEWMEAGLSGIEAYHSSHNPTDMLFFDRLARRQGLLVTGGSDFHGCGGGTPYVGPMKMWKTVFEDTHALKKRISELISN